MSSRQPAGDPMPAPERVLVLTTCLEHRDHMIVLELSMLSGLERVLVDGVLVSRSRNWRRLSQHAFAIEGIRYVLEISIRNPLLATGIKVRLLADGREVDSDQLTAWGQLPDPASGQFLSRRQRWLILLPALAGFGIGVLIARAILTHG